MQKIYIYSSISIYNKYNNITINVNNISYHNILFNYQTIIDIKHDFIISSICELLGQLI